MKLEDVSGIYIVDFFDVCELLKVYSENFTNMKKGALETDENFIQRVENSKSLLSILCGIVKEFQESKDIKSKVVTVTILKKGSKENG